MTTINVPKETMVTNSSLSTRNVIDTNFTIDRYDRHQVLGRVKTLLPMYGSGRTTMWFRFQTGTFPDTYTLIVVTDRITNDVVLLAELVYRSMEHTCTLETLEVIARYRNRGVGSWFLGKLLFDQVILRGNILDLSCTDPLKPWYRKTIAYYSEKLDDAAYVVKEGPSDEEDETKLTITQISTS